MPRCSIVLSHIPTNQPTNSIMSTLVLIDLISSWIYLDAREHECIMEYCEEVMSKNRRASQEQPAVKAVSHFSLAA